MSLVAETESGMRSAKEHFIEELKNLRTGRANPGMLDSVMVDAYGSPMAIKSLATVTIAESRQLLVTPFDPNMAGAIGKGIEKANLNLQPAVEGNVIRVPVPPLNEELRREIVKQGKAKVEAAKVSIREARRKSNDSVKKGKSDGEFTEDDVKRIEKQVQELTDKYCKEIDTLFAEKEKDILAV